MGLFDNFPYNNFHELNLDWVLTVVQESLDNSKTALQTAEDVKTYVDEKLGNLDEEVREIITNQINEAIAAGLEDKNITEIATQIITQSGIGNGMFIENVVVPEWYSGATTTSGIVNNFRNTPISDNKNFPLAQIAVADKYTYNDTDPTANENFKRPVGICHDFELEGFTANTEEAETQNFTGILGVARNSAGGLVGLASVAGRYYASPANENILQYGGNKGTALEGIAFDDQSYNSQGYIIGSEIDLFTRVSTDETPESNPNMDGIADKRRRTTLILGSGSKSRPNTAVLMIQGVNIGGENSAAWNGIVISGSACKVKGLNGYPGTCGINLGSWKSDGNYGHTGIRFGYAVRHIWGREDLNVASRAFNILPTQETPVNLRVVSHTGNPSVLEMGSVDVSTEKPNSSNINIIAKMMATGNRFTIEADDIDFIVSKNNGNKLYNTLATKFRLSPGDTVHVLDFILKCLNKCALEG